MGSQIMTGPLPEEETEQDAAERRIQENLDRLAKRGITPRFMGDYFGFVPQTSRLGSVIEGGLGFAEKVGSEASAAGSIYANPLDTAGAFYQEKAEAARDWLLEPRGAHRTAAFVPEGNDPRTKPGEAQAPPPQGAPPSPSQAVDATSSVTGMTSAQVEPGVSTKPPDGRAIDRPVKGSLGFKAAGGQWIDYDPDTSPDVGAPGRGGYVTADVESMPPVQRPDSYYENLRAKRAIERARPAPGELGAAGFSLEEAAPFLGQEYVRKGQTRGTIEVGREQERMRRETEQEREKRFGDQVGVVQQHLETFKKAMQEAVRSGAITPEVAAILGPRVLPGQPITAEEAAEFVRQAEERATTLVERAQDTAEIGARSNVFSSARY